jgi:hypothetical protein
MNSVQIGQKSYEMPPRGGISVAHFLTFADMFRRTCFERSVVMI